MTSEADAIAHMNSDHADSCRLYATNLLDGADGEWRCVGIDPEGIELQYGRDRAAPAVPAAGYRRPDRCARC